MVNNKRFLKIPGCPVGDIQTVAIGEEYNSIAEELCKLGINTVFIKKNPALTKEIACHADMLLLHLGKNKFYIDESQSELISFLTENGAFVHIKKGIRSPYPLDIALNKLIMGNNAYGLFNRENESDPELFASYNIIKAKQGYTKCSVCLVSENAAITDDINMTSLLKKSQIDVLQIEKGDIYLSENHYGFIGGTGFKIGKNKLFFTGNLKQHRNYKEISDFLKKHMVEPVYNESLRLTDIGGAIQIFEA